MSVIKSFINKPLVAKFQLTKKQEEELIEAFNILDNDGLGVIDSIEKMSITLNAMGIEKTYKEIKAMIDGLPKGSYSKLSLENYLTLVKKEIVKKDSEEEIMKSFTLFDKDHSGSISFEDVKYISNFLNENLTDEEIDEMLEALDKKNTGVVSQEDFLDFFKKSVNLQTE